MALERLEAVEHLAALAAPHLPLLRVQLLRRDAKAREALRASGDQHRSPAMRTQSPSLAATSRLAARAYAAITSGACSARIPETASQPPGCGWEATIGASMRRGLARMVTTAIRNMPGNSRRASRT